MDDSWSAVCRYQTVWSLPECLRNAALTSRKQGMGYCRLAEKGADDSVAAQKAGAAFSSR